MNPGGHGVLQLMSDHWGKLFLAIPVYLCLKTAWLAFYRLTFHPLAHFPGPKLTAATGWFEFYHDVILRGQFVYAVSKMHDEYGEFPGVGDPLVGITLSSQVTGNIGPIVRINPWEISVKDPSFFNTLYVSGSVRRTQIFPPLRDGIGIEGMFSLCHLLAETEHL